MKMIKIKNNNLKKLFIIAISGLVIEICSTFYIRFVAEKNMLGMLFFAFISPFLSLAFAGYMVESKLWKDRFQMAIALSIGYVIGSLIVICFIKDN